jgi:MerR family copper efflux transcriptional regulator
VKIGEAAAALGIAAHVLRHWESLGLLVPLRSPSGHRSYDEQMLDQARVVRTLQHAGFSLGQILGMTRARYEQRAALVDAKRVEIADHITLLVATERYLAHVSTCRHPVIAECPDCAAFIAR